MKAVAFFLAVTLALATSGFAGESTKNPATGPAFKVHGRLSVYNGTPSCRIWVIGTTRILGIAERDPSETSLMPEALRNLVTTNEFFFGDFTVVPLTPDEPGVMRMVRVVAAENLVVTDGRLQFLQRVPGKIEDEPAAPSRKL